MKRALARNEQDGSRKSEDIEDQLDDGKSMDEIMKYLLKGKFDPINSARNQILAKI